VRVVAEVVVADFVVADGVIVNISLARSGGFPHTKFRARCAGLKHPNARDWSLSAAMQSRHMAPPAGGVTRRRYTVRGFRISPLGPAHRSTARHAA